MPSRRFLVRCVETYSTCYIVYADDAIDAQDKMERAYNEGDIEVCCGECLDEVRFEAEPTTRHYRYVNELNPEDNPDFPEECSEDEESND